MGDHYVPAPDSGPLDDSWLEPLRLVQKSLLHKFRPVSHDFFRIYHFMVMAKLVRSGYPDMLIYKHQFTRRPLHVDHELQAYLYVPPRDLHSDEQAQYLPYDSLREAVDALNLWELPWMTEEFHPYRFGVTWEQRWSVRHLLMGDPNNIGPISGWD